MLSCIHKGDPSCHITDSYQESYSKQDGREKDTPPSRDTGFCAPSVRPEYQTDVYEEK